MIDRIVLFDIDRTLIDTGGAGRAAMRSAFNKVASTDPDLATVGNDGCTDRDTFERIIAQCRIDPACYDRIKAAYLQALPETLAQRDVRVLPGVERCLDLLAAHAVPTGIITGNFAEGARKKLDYTRLWNRFAGGAFGDHHRERSLLVSQAVRSVSDAVGRQPLAVQVLVVGDTPADMMAAVEAGASAIGVTTGNWNADALRGAGAEAVLESLEHIEAALTVV